MVKRIVKPNVCRILAAIFALHFTETEATAQPSGQSFEQPDWYVSAGLSGNQVSGMDQSGWNTDATCYPTNSCFFMDPRPDISGYRWRYDPSIDRGIGFDVAVGRSLGRVRLEVSFSQQKNNVEQGASTDGGFLDESLSLTLPPAGETVETDVTTFMDDLVTRTTSVQGYYDLPLGASRFTSYVGLGGGIAFVELTRVFFSIEYSDPSGSVRYDPPLSFYNSKEDTGMSDTVFYLNGIAGIDYNLHARTAIGLKMTIYRMGDIRHDGAYDHHPYHETDPSLTATNTFSATNHLSMTLSVKYGFGN